MSQSEIEAYQEAAVTWHRPTWKLGKGDGREQSERFFDEFSWFGAASNRPDEEIEVPRTRPVTGPVRKALATLDLEPTANLRDIKTRYKTLAKRFHPDANGGSRASEEQLKTVNEAYTFLLTCGYS